MNRKFTAPKLVIATHNQGKLEEIERLFKPYKVKITSNKALGLKEPKETEKTFVGNARIKAHAAVYASHMPALADDSGIEVDGLDGAPGVFTADWAETPDGRNFPMAMEKVWDKLEACNAPTPRTARFRCTLVLAWPDGYDEVFEGKIEGQVVWPMRGDQGHGYDPMFMPDGYDITMGEMERWAKNEISHRADAFNKLIEACFK